MKRAFLLLVLLCLLPIHALAQFITVPDEIYEALKAVMKTIRRNAR